MGNRSYNSVRTNVLHYDTLYNQCCPYNNEGLHRVREIVDDVNDERYCHIDKAADADDTGRGYTRDHGTDERY